MLNFYLMFGNGFYLRIYINGEVIKKETVFTHDILFTIMKNDFNSYLNFHPIK